MKQVTRNTGVRAIAAEAGCSPTLVTMKLNQGKTREQIIAEAAEYRKRQEQKVYKTAPKPEPRQRPVSVVEPRAVAAMEAAFNAADELFIQSEDFNSAQRRKEIALANLRELELAEKQGVLVNANEVAEGWAALVSEAKSKLMLIPDELCDRLAVESHPVRCREIMREEIRAALEVLAKGQAA